MNAKRYLTTVCVIFQNNKIVPVWECEYRKSQYGGIEFSHDDETSSHVEECIYDLKKREIVSFYEIILESTSDKVLAVGDKVVDLSNSYKGTAVLATIKEVVDDDPECYYEKIDSQIRSIYPGIPLEAKVLVKKYKKYRYVLEGGTKAIHPTDIKRLV